MKATFGAGCFWHVEEAFRSIKGVLKTTVGYMGGSMDTPSYEDVHTGDTGHAEVCQIEFDPKKVKYEDLLGVFWKIHDPTQAGGQGSDLGSQYRSVIFYHNKNQRESALKSKKEQQKNYSKKIITEILIAPAFYEAEEYHQKYLFKRNRKTC
ncbi:MAG: peptide-methionine (S)-S-oxide reductase MsrA [Nanoarchaeota archaeon]